MPRTYTRLELRTRLREMTDTQNDTHLSDNELNNILDSAAAETTDQIILAGLQSENVKTVTFNSVANQLTYPLSSVVAAGDFYKVYQLYVDEGNGQRRPLPRIQSAEVLNYKPVQSAIPLILLYVPYQPKMTSDSDTFDGINGWEEHLLVTAAITVKAKKEDDSSVFRARKRELEGRMQTMGNRVWSEPPRVMKRRRTQTRYPWGWTKQVDAWDYIGGSIYLYYNYGQYMYW
jgi:hypothetical protein